MSDDPSIQDLQETSKPSSNSAASTGSVSDSNSSSNRQSENTENVPAAHDADGSDAGEVVDAGKGPQEFEFGEPAEVLVELAKRGEIDPWDIDIALATEKFLQYIDSLEKRDLRIPARTLLYSSILLRMKSDSMEGQKEEEAEPEMEEIEDEPQEEIEESLPRPPVRRLTKRPVTLDELISELKKAEMVGRRKAMRERWPSTEEKALDVSHDEGIEERIKALGPILNDMFMEKKSVSFQDINSKNSKTEDGVTNYVSLLFMAQRKQVWLEQEEIFGDLFVKRHA